MDSIKEQIGYHNYYRVGAFEAAQMVTDACPPGWKGTFAKAGEDEIRLLDLERKGFAFRVGQVKPSGMEFALYAYNMEAMQQHHADFDIVREGIKISDIKLIAKGTPGPAKQFPHRKELRYSDVEKSALDALTADGEDASELIRRLIREEHARRTA